MSEWIDRRDFLPNFNVHGFHTGRKVEFRLPDGSEHVGIYQGYGIFGAGTGRWGVTHWRPAGDEPASTLTMTRLSDDAGEQL